jgi:hypothetical protein
MSYDRKVKKLILLWDILSIDEEEYTEKEKVYLSEFQADFKDESNFWEFVHGKKDKKTLNKSMPTLVTKSMIKKMHRDLVNITHPDKTSDISKNEDFLEIQAAYETHNAAILLKKAVKYNIKITLDEETYGLIENQIIMQREKIEKIKESACWVWCVSNKNEELRKKIRKIIGIDEEKFHEWVKSGSNKKT